MEDYSIAIAKYDYTAEGEGELTIRKYEKLTVIDDSQPWWKVQNERSNAGYVPSNYLTRKDSAAKGKKNIIDNLKNKVLKNKRNDGGGDAAQVDTQSPKLKSSGKVLMLGTAKFKYIPQRDDEIELNRGDQVTIMEMEHDGWCRGECNGKTGWFPFNYIQKLENQNEAPPSSEYASPSEVIEMPFICKVRTLYPFTSQTNEELSFEKDSILEIIEKPKDDPDWWQARKSNGDIGLVPRNYVEEIVSPVMTPGPSKSSQNNFPELTKSAGSNIAPTRDIGPDGKFNDRDWYHGSMSRQQCEHILKNQAKFGEYLVRNSESKPGDFSLSMKAPDRMKHFKISHVNNQYVIGQRTFESMDILISHYAKAPIYTTDSGEKMFLVKPVSKALTRNGFS